MPKVLVVDDELVLSRNIKAYLSRHGYAVEHAATGQSALATLAATAFDVLDLPVPDGPSMATITGWAVRAAPLSTAGHLPGEG